MAKILVVDDNVPFRNVFSETLISLKHEPTEASSGEEALSKLASMTPDMVFLDLRLPGISGLDVLRQLRQNSSTKDIPVVILTAYADSANTIEAMKLGAFDHLTKPIGRDVLKQLLAKAVPEPSHPSDKDIVVNDRDELIGASPSFREVQKLIGLAAANNSPVLLVGETGTGRELIARSIHQYSERPRDLFKTIMCISPEDGFEHFVDNQSTIYLNELADLSPQNQALLLTALRASATNSGRVISSCRVDLLELVKKGSFREDLYYLLSAFPIFVPPLRARGSDVLVLAEAFLYRLNAQKTKRLTAAAAKELLEYDWPGNIQELNNMIQRAAVVGRGEMIDTADLFETRATASGEMTLGDLLKLDYHTAIASVEKLLFERALKAACGNRTAAAKALGVHRQLLYTKLKEHNLD